MTEPAYTDGSRVWLYHADSRAYLRELPDACVDAVVTDPPYELGFMGKTWDGSGVAYDVDLWREALRVLKPGGHLLAFGGTRTWHRLACAIEDAGFEVRDSIAWLYGSGFPKSLDVSKAIDKLDAAAERLARAREFQSWLSQHLTPQQVNTATDTEMGHHLTTHPTQPLVATADMFDRLRPMLPEVPERIEQIVADRTVESENYKAREVVGERITGIGTGAGSVAYIGDSDNRDVTVAHTPAARQWQGWGTALKPAFEPVVVARKPLIGTVAANVLAHGVGALNIDGCRIEHASEADRAESEGKNKHAQYGSAPGATNTYGTYTADHVKDYTAAAGRWPANVTLDDYCAGDTGGASRFFYVAKAPTKERPKVDGVAHPTVKPLALMRWLVRLVTPPGGVVLDPFAGSGTTIEAALLEGFRAVGVEMTDEYLPLITARIERVAPGEVAS